MADISTDPRLDPRIQQLMGSMPPAQAEDVGSREELLAMFNDSDLRERRDKMEAMFDLIDELDITVFGTGAKAIAAWEKAGLRPRKTHELNRTILHAAGQTSVGAHPHCRRSSTAPQPCQCRWKT